MPPTPTTRTDDELIAATDVGGLLRYGLSRDAFRTALFGDGAVAAAVTLDRLGVLPRSVAFLADTVRAGGVRYVAELPEPLPSAEASEVLRGWLRTAADVAAAPDAEDRAARWLAGVAELIGARRDARGSRR
ncbi:hypothetical protein ACIBU0_05235 [Streptomyces sp. NPDC049627]|uniref:hypothetical protein n=1 Tax=Streptomyces sp. NPDC049627 TaxID=3365595 RepID=UPI0037AD49DF